MPSLPFTSLSLYNEGPTLLVEGTECTVAWCSVNNWQPLTYGVYFYGELKESNDERQLVLIGS